MTAKDLMTNDQRRRFTMWGIKAKYHSTIGRAFRSIKHLDKSVGYYDKRWGLVIEVLQQHGCL